MLIFDIKKYCKTSFYNIDSQNIDQVITLGLILELLNNTMNSISGFFLDSPANTSAITYGWKFILIIVILDLIGI